MGDESLSAYAHVLRVSPDHYGAIMRFGALLSAHGQSQAARTVFAEAVRRHPNVAAPYVCLGSILVDAGENGDALRAYERAAELDPEHREAQRGIAVILEREGRLAAAERRWRLAFPHGSIERVPYRGRDEPCRVLFITSALGGNVPMQHVIDDRLFESITVISESAPPEIALPPHDVVFNAVGDADRCTRALEFVARIVARSGARILNDPARVGATTREENARRLRDLPGVVAPRVARIARAALLAGSDPGFGWPLLVRSPGYHTGEHFVRVERPEDLGSALASLPGDELLAIEYVETRGADGGVRKYRVMTIGGRLYPLHLAIAGDWKVHYYTAGMGERAEHRDEERAFLEDMRAALGPRAVAALAAIAERLGLDYGGIDFTLDGQGRVVLFEANATMVILPPDADPRWDYRRPAIRRAIEGARALLLGRPLRP
jgi:glutathione synthase/RimK-type ligase-like ATP-grasp enzyme